MCSKSQKFCGEFGMHENYNIEGLSQIHLNLQVTEGPADIWVTHLFPCQ